MSEASTAPLVIAHRGASAYEPENTFPAYELAVEQRADMIEVDLHTTRDGHIVIAHDAQLMGLGESGEIAEATLDEVQALDAGKGERVPTLEAMLDGFGGRIPFNLELKRGVDGVYEGMPAATVAAVRERGLEKQTLYSSFYDPVLRDLREQSPYARIALLVSRTYPQKKFERARAVGAEALNPEESLVTAELVREAHGEGLKVYPYTVDDPDRMQELLGFGVDGLFTNVPDRMRALVDG